MTPWTAAAAALVAFAAVACRNGVQYEQRNGPGIAEHIGSLQSPIVSEVRYRPGTLFESASIVVMLETGVTADDAQEFICRVALPYAESADPPSGLTIVAFNNPSQTLATDTPCR